MFGPYDVKWVDGFHNKSNWMWMNGYRFALGEMIYGKLAGKKVVAHNLDRFFDAIEKRGFSLNPAVFDKYAHLYEIPFEKKDRPYSSFKASYLETHKSKRAFIVRKLVAMPSICISLAQSIYHLFKSLKTFTIKDTRFYEFKAYRYLEEANGWFITLFSDVLGQYWVQRAMYHCQYYDRYQAQPKAREKWETALCSFDYRFMSAAILGFVAASAFSWFRH